MFLSPRVRFYISDPPNVQISPILLALHFPCFFNAATALYVDTRGHRRLLPSNLGQFWARKAHVAHFSGRGEHIELVIWKGM